MAGDIPGGNGVTFTSSADDSNEGVPGVEGGVGVPLLIDPGDTCIDAGLSAGGGVIEKDSSDDIDGKDLLHETERGSRAADLVEEDDALGRLGVEKCERLLPLVFELGSLSKLYSLSESGSNGAA